MYEPRRVEETNSVEEDIKILKAEISKLRNEIDSVNVDDNYSNTEIRYDEVLKIFDSENESLREFIEYEKKRKEELIKELSTLSDYVEEEENFISSINDYMKNEGTFKTEVAVDNEMEFHFKLEVLHRKICSLIKKIGHDIDNETDQTDLPNTSKKLKKVHKNTHSHSTHQKSLLDLLKQLIPELRTEGTTVEEDPVVTIDETINAKHIKFLLSANIIEKCSDNPEKIKLAE